jgi:predicted  nucleic acid-binding Zn-ribbon protein
MARKASGEHVAYGQTKAEKARSMKSGHRDVYRRALSEFRERLAAVQAEKKANVGQVRKVCQRAKRVQKLQLAELRKKARDEMNARIREAKKALRHKCGCRVKTLQKTAQTKAAGVRAEAAARRKLERDLISTEERIKREHAKKLRAGERLAESREAVLTELPPELRPVFKAVGHRIKTRGKQSRAEAFIKWAEEHPSEVEEYMARHAGRLAEQDIRELKKHERSMTKKLPRKAKALGYSLEELEGLKRLGIDPFAERKAAGAEAPF